MSDDKPGDDVHATSADGRSGGPPPEPSAAASTADSSYAERLNKLQAKRWKKLLNVQAPYRANLRRYRLGRVLDVGCGNGRNLLALSADSVGVDHNPHLVRSARELGLHAHTTDEFFADSGLSAPGSFDAILAAHLVEHLDHREARTVLSMYLPMVRPGGQVVLITPQERGHASDPTHVEFTDFASLRQLSDDLGLITVRQFSFPFPRALGRVFVYNEFNHLAQVPAH